MKDVEGVRGKRDHSAFEHVYSRIELLNRSIILNREALTEQDFF
jgi:hypothetical protein